MENEKKMVLLCSRITLNKENINQINEILNGKLEWNLICQYAQRNKVMGLVFYNLFKLGFRESIPKWCQLMVDDYMYCNVLRNDVKLQELCIVQKEFEKNDILCLPVKGAYMIDNLYKNRAIRITNDIDALISKKDINKITGCLTELGYENGFYNPETKIIEKASAVKKILYKTKMYNLIPFSKVVNKQLGSVVTFDLSFALDFSLETSPVEKMLKSTYIKNGVRVCKPEIYFVHMCCHHYREASHMEWFKIGSDLNLIKFCDVRELLIQQMNFESRAEAIKFAKDFHLEKAIYFTLYYLKILFNDGYEDEMMQQLTIEDTKFVHEYGDGEKIYTRKKGVWNSFFDEDNKDEIRQKAKYEEII